VRFKLLLGLFEGASNVPWAFSVPRDIEVEIFTFTDLSHQAFLSLTVPIRGVTFSESSEYQE